MDVATLVIDDVSLRKAIATVDYSRIVRPLCDEYSLAFGRQVDVSPDLEPPLTFLAIICGWRLRPNDEQMPFERIWHPVGVEDITEPQIEAVAAVSPDVGDPELRARMADLTWLRLRHHKLARLAADDYLMSAERLIRGGHWTGTEERLQRALQLATLLGRSDALLSNVVDRIVALSHSNLPSCAVAECLRVLRAARRGDAAELYSIAHDRACSIAGAEPNPLWERAFWELAADFAVMMKDEHLQRNAMLRVAGTYEREAQSSPLQAVAAGFLESALQTYRRVSGTDDDRRRVHEMLLRAQEQIPKEMKPLSTEPIDITDLVEQSRMRIRGKEKRAAIAEIALASRWLEKEVLRKQVEQSLSQYPLQQMFASKRFSSAWKVAATAGPAYSNLSEIAEDRLKAEMCQHYRFFIPIAVSGTIEPMRHELLYAYSVTMGDIAEFVYNSPVVPPGREPIYTAGIHAGVHGRLMEAVHLLVPQLEHMLRYLLKEKGTITSSIDNDGIQQEFDLNRILVMEEATSFLGADLGFALRVLFTERYGYNFRNELSHGMLSPGAFFSDPAIYAWWLVFRLVAGQYAQSVIVQARSEA